MKVLYFFLSLFLIVFFSFVLMRFLPGGPFDSETALMPEVRLALETKYGLNKPVLTQFMGYLNAVLHGDLGVSTRYYGERSVRDIIQSGFLVSFQLGAMAFGAALLVGLFLGSLAWIFPNRLAREILFWVSSSLISIPNYLVATVLVLVFAVYLDWLPVALWEGPQSKILPVIVLCLKPAGILSRFLQERFEEIEEAPFIWLARSKNLPSWRVFIVHALRPALIPALAFLAPMFAQLVTGSFIVESVFALPGLGKHFVFSVLDRDYSLLAGLVIVYGTMLLTVNMLMDVAYGWLDPRMRTSEASKS